MSELELKTFSERKEKENLSLFALKKFLVPVGGIK